MMRFLESTKCIHTIINFKQDTVYYVYDTTTLTALYVSLYVFKCNNMYHTNQEIACFYRTTTCYFFVQYVHSQTRLLYL